MGQVLFSQAIRADLERFLAEDDLSRNLFYTQALPEKNAKCSLYFKSDLVIAGLPWFFETFAVLGATVPSELIKEFEGQKVKAKDKVQIDFELPFAMALTGERVALNLLQQASSIATCTARFVEKAQTKGIAILDTRKTTPGLRSFEKYAVRVGGGCNHRLAQTDTWMVKDNHKTFFGGLREAIHFFKSMQTFYNAMVVEIHSLNELREAITLGVQHVMLDNFSPEQIKEAVKIKPNGMTYEVSGGVRLETLEQFLISGVDAISVGAITYDAPHVDISLKYKAAL